MALTCTFQLGVLRMKWTTWKLFAVKTEVFGNCIQFHSPCFVFCSLDTSNYCMKILLM